MSDGSAPPAIAVRDLWQVFGPKARQALRAALPKGRDAAAEALLSQGLIPAVRDANFDVAEGELFVIMGLSGSGKSTLIRCISRLVEPTHGSVKMGGEDVLTASKRRMIKLRRQKMGMVFQHFGLFPHMSVSENVAYPLRVNRVKPSERQARAAEVLELVGLADRMDAYPRELSGGQRQRVGIARSLAVNPDIWFLDEPFSALDPLIRRQLQDEFLSIQATLGKSIVFITHDIAEALKLADRIAIMRDGVIVQIGTPSEIVLNPVDDYVRAFSRDVPRGRHMQVSAIMEPATFDTTVDANSGDSLSVAMSLEDALAHFPHAGTPLPVKDGDGKVVGQLDPGKLTRVLAAQAE